MFKRNKDKQYSVNDDATAIYKLYEKGVDHHNKINLYSKTEIAHRMFIGEQWYGLEAGEEKLPFFNIIQPTVEHKVASIAMNNMSINYNSLNYDGNRQYMQNICELLNKKAAQAWELLKMDSLVWQVVNDACIAGDSYLYFYDGIGAAQVIDNTNVYLSNEQDSNIQTQKYILIAERRFVTEIQEEAKENGIDDTQISMITSDEETRYQLGEDARHELQNSGQYDGKCLSLLKLWKDDNGTVHFCRSTKNVIYQPDTAIDGLTVYPIANYVWLPKKGSARGMGEVTPLVANQIEINRNLSRRIMNAKLTAFSRLVYSSGAIDNINDLDKVGVALQVSGGAGSVKDYITYLEPSPMSPDAKNLNDELINTTKDLAGAGDAAMGSINPERASGSAIIAVRDQAAIPLNRQISDYKQFIEDIATIWYNLWVAYNPNGLEIAVSDGEEDIQENVSAEDLQVLEVNVRIDVSQANPFSKFAQEQSLEKLFEMQAITFDEYVSALDSDSVMPKGKLQDIIDKRGQQQQIMQMLQQQSELIQQQSSAIQAMQTARGQGGGTVADVPDMQEQIAQAGG